MFISYFHVYRPLNIGRSFSHFVRLSCAHASPLAIWLKTAQRLFLRFCPPQRLFPKCLTSHRFAAASNATSGREQRYLRPRAARTAAASRQLLLIARRAPTGWWRKSVKDAASARCRREARRQAGMPHLSRGQTLLSPPFSPSPPRSLSPSFSAIHHLQPTKRKINFKKNDKLLPEINN